MSVKIRLARFGAKKHPFYRVIVADSRMPRDGRFIEILGFYNPMVSKDHSDFIKVNAKRVKYWLSKGAQSSDRVLWFIKKGFINIEDDLKNA